MKLTFLGAGSAFTPISGDNLQSNILATASNGNHMAVDCGTHFHHALDIAGIDVTKITALYITHLHADHIGGVEELCFKLKFAFQKKIDLYIVADIKDEFWSSIGPGLQSLQCEIATLETYFNVHVVRPNETFVWEGQEFRPVQVVHIYDGYRIVPSFGLKWQQNGDGLRYFFTSDAQHQPHQIQDMYNESDIIFQDCETSPFKSKVHAHFDELKTLDDATRKKMVLYHYQPGERPDAKKAGFKGYAHLGMILDLNTGKVINGKYL